MIINGLNYVIDIAHIISNVYFLILYAVNSI